MENLWISRQSGTNVDGSPVDMSPINARWILYADSSSCRSVDLDVRYHSEEYDYVKSAASSDKSILVFLYCRTIVLPRKIWQIHLIQLVFERRAPFCPQKIKPDLGWTLPTVKLVHGLYSIGNKIWLYKPSGVSHLLQELDLWYLTKSHPSQKKDNIQVSPDYLLLYSLVAFFHKVGLNQIFLSGFLAQSSCYSTTPLNSSLG